MIFFYFTEAEAEQLRVDCRSPELRKRIEDELHIARMFDNDVEMIVLRKGPEGSELEVVATVYTDAEKAEAAWAAGLNSQSCSSSRRTATTASTPRSSTTRRKTSAAV